MRRLIPILFALFLISNFLLPVVLAEDEQSVVCAVYFTGVGCSHCAKTDPIILVDLLKKYPDLVVIEYEIYQQQINAPLLYQYDSEYNSGLGIPLIIFNKNEYFIGDTPILKNAEGIIDKLDHNDCFLIDGSSVDFNNLDATSLEGQPKIWRNERILLKISDSGDNEVLKKLLTTDNISSVIEGINYNIIEPKPIPLSGKKIHFDNAIQLGGWIFQWNGEKINIGTQQNTTSTIINISQGAKSDRGEKLTLTKIFSLAAVDAINPCALAVLSLMLIAILTYNPKEKRNILLAGLAFTCSVFIMYLFYGLVIIKSFQLIQALTSVRVLLYKILGFAAIILGVLNIKDAVRYKAGSFLTEMPLSIRPRVKKIISGITSPKGAFITGLFVTVFLLPCTIGPYVIAGGILSTLELIKTIPFLLLYNLIFVLPMIVITLIVYVGFAKIEDVSGWKDKNIRYLHLITGLIMFVLGLAMVLGWV
jgi:thiol-disulfide isomerase/thioredoxin